jgi:thioredoxin 2
MPTSYLVKCNSCGASNRIPAEKEGVKGHCGKCQALLPALYWQPQQMTEQSFDRFMAGYDGPVLAEFWAPW